MWMSRAECIICIIVITIGNAELLINETFKGQLYTHPKRYFMIAQSTRTRVIQINIQITFNLHGQDQAPELITGVKLVAGRNRIGKAVPESFDWSRFNIIASNHRVPLEQD